MTATTPLTRTLARCRRTITDAPVSYSVYSAFSFYGPQQGFELPGAWIVAALGVLGHEPAAIRQTLYRMEGSQELSSRVDGRNKYYRLTPAARAEADAGLQKILHGDTGPWDGEWTLVHFRSGSEQRVERERLRELLHSEGFASIGAGLYAHPRDRSRRFLDAARGHDALELVEVFRARRLGEAPRGFVARHWDLAALSTRYERFLRRFQPIDRAAHRFPPEAAFVARFAVVFEFLETAWRDPGLPADLLPERWAGARAQRLAGALYQRLLPNAIAYGDQVMARVRR